MNIKKESYTIKHLIDRIKKDRIVLGQDDENIDKLSEKISTFYV